MKKENKVVIYQAKTGAIELREDIHAETIWATLQQIACLFDTDKSGISRHIKNIFDSNELDQRATVAIFATVPPKVGVSRSSSRPPEGRGRGY